MLKNARNVQKDHLFILLNKDDISRQYLQHRIQSLVLNREKQV